jgi:hypothetical protein
MTWTAQRATYVQCTVTFVSAIENGAQKGGEILVTNLFPLHPETTKY